MSGKKIKAKKRFIFHIQKPLMTLVILFVVGLIISWPIFLSIFHNSPNKLFNNIAVASTITNTQKVTDTALKDTVVPITDVPTTDTQTPITSASILPTETLIPSKLSKRKFEPLNLPILMYHHIRNIDSSIDKLGQRLSVSPQQFDLQLSVLKNAGYHSISFEDLIDYINYADRPLPSKSIILSFDDGYEDNYINAAPILKKFGYHGNFGIITGMVGMNDYMNWDQIKSLKAEGNNIDSHSVHHPDLAKENEQRLIYELAESKKTLDSVLSQNTRVIIYPSGKYSPLVMNTAVKEGYWIGRTTEYGHTITSNNLMNLPAIRMFDETNLNSVLGIHS